MEQQLQQAANAWANALASGNSANVVAQYHPQGGLWGTFADQYNTGPGEIGAYFDELLKKERLQCEFLTGNVRDEGSFVFFSGSYRFSWIENGAEQFLPARFSFVFKREADQLLIFEHHSSKFP